jgi:hypothetical protein
MMDAGDEDSDAAGEESEPDTESDDGEERDDDEEGARGGHSLFDVDDTETF